MNQVHLPAAGITGQAIADAADALDPYPYPELAAVDRVVAVDR